MQLAKEIKNRNIVNSRVSGLLSSEFHKQENQ
jgi:hypothetical protein